MDNTSRTVSLSALAAAVGVTYPVARRWYDDGMPHVIADPLRLNPDQALAWLVGAGKITPEWAVIAERNLNGGAHD